MNQRIIGLTGGIACGKTTVSQYLQEKYQLPILDADIYARKAVEVGSPILKAIINRYGADILLADGNLNRAKLGEIVFKNPIERQWLEAQIHPFVEQSLITAISDYSHHQIIVLVIPLLFEANMTHLVTEIWVVNCLESQQIQRLMQRNGLNREQAQARINSQFPLAEKIKKADVVLDNLSDLECLYAQIDQVLRGREVNISEHLIRNS